MASSSSREQAQDLLDHLEHTLQNDVETAFFVDPKKFRCANGTTYMCSLVEHMCVLTCFLDANERSLPRVVDILGENLQMDQAASWTSTITVPYLQEHNAAYQTVLRQVRRQVDTRGLC